MENKNITPEEKEENSLNASQEDASQDEAVKEDSSPKEVSQAEKYYEEHMDDLDIYKLKKKKDSKDDFVPDPDKSQAENYYDENIEKLENAYKLKKKDKENKKTTSNIDAQKFDEKEFPTVREGDEQDENEPHVAIEYDLTADEVETGMKYFQKRMLFKRNMAYTISFGVLFVVFWIQLFLNSSRSGITLAGIAVCACAVFIIWYNPKRYRQSTAKAMSLIEDKFTMNIYRDYIYIQEQSGGMRIPYSDEKNIVIEQDDKYIICVGKERFYLVPKRCLEQAQEEEISEYLKNLGDRFIKAIEQ